MPSALATIARKCGDPVTPGTLSMLFACTLASWNSSTSTSEKCATDLTKKIQHVTEGALELLDIYIFFTFGQRASGCFPVSCLYSKLS